MDDGIGTDSDGNNMTLADILAGDDEDIADTVSDSLEAQKLYRTMRRVLTDAEYKIIFRRYGLCGTRRMTQREIADELDISRSYVSRIEKKCLQKLADEYRL